MPIWLQTGRKLAKSIQLASFIYPGKRVKLTIKNYYYENNES